MLPPVLATNSGAIDSNPRILRFSGIPRKTHAGVAGSGRLSLHAPAAGRQCRRPVAAAGSGDEFGGHRFKPPNSAVFRDSPENSCRRCRRRLLRNPTARFAVTSPFRGGQTVKKPPESSRGPQPFRTFNRAQRRVRWARGDFCAGKSHFPEKKSFPCSLRARKIFDF